MHKIFILEDIINNGSYIILNTNNDEMIQRFRKQENTWEMPEDTVKQVFSGKEEYADNFTCSIKKLDTESEFPFEVEFTPPVVDIEQLKNDKLREAEQFLNAKLTELSNYPRAESASFDIQEKEAVAYLANTEIDNAEIPVITGIAVGAQMNLTLLAKSIVQNAKDFAPLRGLYLGRHKRVRDVLNKAETPAEVEAVNVQAIFEEEIKSQTTLVQE